MCVGFRLVEVGILSGYNILLKRMDLRCSYRPRPPSAARAAVWMGKAMGCNGPRGQKTRTKTKKQDGVVGPNLENKMAPGFRLEELDILSGWSILLKRIAL